MLKHFNFILSIVFILTFNLSCTKKDKEPEEAKRAGERTIPKDAEKDVIKLNEKSFKRMGIKVEKAVARVIPSFIETTAKIEFNANQLVQIKPRVPGRVVEMFADFGQDVKEGETLALLDSIELAKAIDEYKARKAKLTVALANYERESRLWEKNVSSEKDMLTAKGEYLSLKADLEEVRERLHLFGLSHEDVESISKEERPTSTFPILSPFEGTTVDKKITLGEVIAPTDTLFTIANLNVMWIIASIYEKDISKVKLNQGAEILVETYPDEVFPGKITYISNMVDEKTRTVKVRVEIDNKNRKLKAGMFANVRIYTDESKEIQKQLFVPSVAIQRLDGRNIVFTSKGNYAFEARQVETGKEQEGFTAVLSGLKEGEEMVTKGSFYLKSEMLKETIEATEE
ncbi:MAG TPA: efflux RND transporter periplasmic adaptor subunit [Candidatus Hypogeohydataceae bacterium YC41]